MVCSAMEAADDLSWVKIPGRIIMAEGFTDLDFSVKFEVKSENKLSYSIYIPRSFTS